MKLLNITIFIVSLYLPLNALPIKQVVIWGHKLHSHTHSYIHAAFDKTFRYLGYKTLWLDGSDATVSIDFSGSLFITEGQVDERIPLRDDCWYILHNCGYEKYRDLFNKNRCISLQVYTHDVLTRDVERREPYIYYDLPGKIIYMPWATDLLPDEIDAIKATVSVERQKIAVFIGTISGGYFGNDIHIHGFKKACMENGIFFVHKMQLSLEDTIALTQKSYMAPAIQGSWQVEKGYIPCRIFKNISYGNFGITNSKTVWELFERKIIYNPDCYHLFYDAKKTLKTLTLDDLKELMDFVKEKHTYLNRVNHLLEFFDRVVEAS